MSDILDELVVSAHQRVELGYYDISSQRPDSKRSSFFTQKIKNQNCDPIVGELKPGSPTRGKIFEDSFKPTELGKTYSEGGAVGFSVLTDPDGFFGSLENLTRVAKLNKPTLMKDFIVDYSQIKAGKELGANAVLFIHRLFSREISCFGLDEGIDYAHELGLEVLLEVNDVAEYESGLKTEADMIGINNRDLRSLQVDLSATKRILSKAGKDRLVWSMSGITSRADIVFLKEAGADAFLVGTSLTRSENPKRLVQKLCGVGDG